MVRIEGGPNGSSSPGNYTFYGRYASGLPGGDNRKPLATTWGQRYVSGSAYDQDYLGLDLQLQKRFSDNWLLGGGFGDLEQGFAGGAPTLGGCSPGTCAFENRPLGGPPGRAPGLPGTNPTPPEGSGAGDGDPFLEYVENFLSQGAAGEKVSATAKAGAGPVAADLHSPSIQAPREAARRVPSANNLRQVTIARQIFGDAADRYKTLPRIIGMPVATVPGDLFVSGENYGTAEVIRTADGQVHAVGTGQYAGWDFGTTKQSGSLGAWRPEGLPGRQFVPPPATWAPNNPRAALQTTDVAFNRVFDALNVPNIPQGPTRGSLGLDLFSDVPEIIRGRELRIGIKPSP